MNLISTLVFSVLSAQSRASNITTSGVVPSPVGADTLDHDPSNSTNIVTLSKCYSTSTALNSPTSNNTLTTVVTAYTTYCPEPTTICPGNGKCYTVTKATTLTITDCPCTLTTAGSSPTLKPSVLVPATTKKSPAPAPAPATTKKSPAPAPAPAPATPKTSPAPAPAPANTKQPVLVTSKHSTASVAPVISPAASSGSVVLANGASFNKVSFIIGSGALGAALMLL